jgi:hypothetical protein
VSRAALFIGGQESPAAHGSGFFFFAGAVSGLIACQACLRPIGGAAVTVETAAPHDTAGQVGFERVCLRRQFSPLPRELLEARAILRIHRNGGLLVAKLGLPPEVF